MYNNVYVLEAAGAKIHYVEIQRQGHPIGRFSECDPELAAFRIAKNGGKFDSAVQLEHLIAGAHGVLPLRALSPKETEEMESLVAEHSLNSRAAGLPSPNGIPRLAQLFEKFSH